MVVPDDLWAAVLRILPQEPERPKGGRPKASDRAALAGILWVLRTNGRWPDMPRTIGRSGMTCSRRLREWQRVQGGSVWACIEKLLRQHLPDAASFAWHRTRPNSPFATPKKRTSRRLTLAKLMEPEEFARLRFDAWKAKADPRTAANPRVVYLEHLESLVETQGAETAPIDFAAALGLDGLESLLVSSEEADQPTPREQSIDLEILFGSEEPPPDTPASEAPARPDLPKVDGTSVTLGDLVKAGFRAPSGIGERPPDADDRAKPLTAGEQRAWELRVGGQGEPERPTRILPGQGPQGALLRGMLATPWQDAAAAQGPRPEIYVRKLPRPGDFYYGGRHGPVRRRLVTDVGRLGPLPDAFLGWKEFKQLHDALHFAYRQGLVMNATVTVAWFLLEPYGLDLSAQQRAFERFRRELARWFGLRQKELRRHGIDIPGSHFAWVHENPHPTSGKLHTHLLVHVPPVLVGAFEAFLPEAVARAARLSPDGLPASLLGKRVRRPDQDALYGQWRWFHYVTKGAKAEARLPAPAGRDGYRLGNLMHHWYQNPGPAPDALGGRYVGCTHSLTPRGRQARCAATKEASASVLSTQCRTGQIDVRLLYPGYEHGQRRGPLRAPPAPFVRWQRRQLQPATEEKHPVGPRQPERGVEALLNPATSGPSPHSAELGRGRQWASGVNPHPPIRALAQPRTWEAEVRARAVAGEQPAAQLAQKVGRSS